MKLIELKLKNIKTYVDETIKFSDGINCILGLNGSGKSSIIESIGYVLFNYSQRTSNNLLRYNETKGSISLKFIGNDDITYQIIRNIRSKNSSIKIINVENNQVLYENVSDVYAFVKKILNIPKEKSLSKMFEEIIAVPQGTFVNAFLDTPKNRKENFDKLFELDIYKILGDNTKKLIDILDKQYIYELEKEKSLIEGQLFDYDNKVQEKNKLIEYDKELEKEKNNSFLLYNKKEEEKQKQEQINKEYISLINKEKEINASVDNLNIVLNETNVQYNNSKVAHEIIMQNEFGYNMYLKTSKELIQNEIDYNNLLEITKIIESNKKDLISIEEQNLIINNSIIDCKKEIGSHKQTIIDKNSLIDEKNIIIKKDNEALSILKEKEKELYEQLNDRKTKITICLEKLKSFYNYLLLIDKDKYVINYDEKLNEINYKLQDIKINKEKINIFEKEKIEINSYLKNIENNQQYILDGKCPIFKEKCLNIKNKSLNNEMENIINENYEKIKILNNKIDDLISKCQIEEQLIKEKEVLELSKIEVEKEKERYISNLNEIKAIVEIDIEINENNDLDVVNSLINRFEEELKSLTNSEYEITKEKINKLQNDIISNNSIIQINNNSINELNKIIDNLLLKIEKNENLIKENNVKVTNIQNSLTDLEKNKLLYSESKQTLENNKKIKKKFEQNYEIYMSNKKEADLLLQLKEKLDIYELQIKQLNIDLKIIQENIMNSKTVYSEEKLLLLNNEIIELSKLISKYETTLNINKERIDTLNKELDMLNSKKTDLKDIITKINNYIELNNKYKLLREIYNNLPKELSKQIRKYISTYSTVLYRKISNENIRIDILDDYEVILVDCVDESKVKNLSQLSGGEQMSVSIAIRLAMLKQITNVDIYFMDEPTINLDYERRIMVSEVVKDISNELNQLFVISHDDTFEAITDNTIKLKKHNNISVLDM